MTRPSPGQGPTPRTLAAARLAGLVLLLIASSTAHAAQGPPAAAPAPGATPGRGATLTARYHVRQMENVLERAVEHAADLMRRRLQTVTPDVLALAGAPRAQGFRIEGYGLFFSVEVPRLSESVNWALRVLSQDRDERVLASLHKLASAEQDPAVRADLERAMRTVQLQLSVPPRLPLGNPPAPNPPAPAGVAAPVATAAADARLAEPAPDPSAVYESEVKQALVDAMLDYAGSLPLEGPEWVTVAARDAGYVAFPDAVSDMVTVTLSVRVSDLHEFRAQRLSREQARARVLLREF